MKTILQPLNTVENVKFSSLNNLIASVSSAGRVTARSIGTTYLVAAIDNGKYDVCRVIVVDEEAYLALLENPEIDPLTLIPLEENVSESDDIELSPVTDNEAADITEKTVNTDDITDAKVNSTLSDIANMQTEPFSSK